MLHFSNLIPRQEQQQEQQEQQSFFEDLWAELAVKKLFYMIYLLDSFLNSANILNIKVVKIAYGFMEETMLMRQKRLNCCCTHAQKSRENMWTNGRIAFGKGAGSTGDRGKILKLLQQYLNFCFLEKLEIFNWAYTQIWTQVTANFDLLQLWRSKKWHKTR